MIIKNTLLKVGPIVRVVQFDSISDVLSYLKHKHFNTKNMKIQYIDGKTVLDTHGEFGLISDEVVFEEYEDGSISVIDKNSLFSKAIPFGELPAQVFNWLNSAACQHMSLSQALGNDFSSKYNYSGLTSEVTRWLKLAGNQRLFALSLLAWPLTNEKHFGETYSKQQIIKERL